MTETYEDWQRKLNACALAADIAVVPGAPEALLILNHPERAPWGLTSAQSARFWAVAAALGIDKRRALPWVADGRDLIANVSEGTEALVGGGECEGFVAVLYMKNGPDWLRVVMHPSQESAVEHLERLHGREVR
jgi:hypothetical protein